MKVGEIMQSIISNESVANQVANNFHTIESISKREIELGNNNLSGMKQGKNVSEQMVQQLEELSRYIKAQANKFPQIASLITQDDRHHATNIREGLKNG